MRTPAQALRDAIKSGAVEAWGRGQKIQYRGEESPFTYWTAHEDCAPQFSDEDLFWRPAPAKRRIPFAQATVPKGALWNLRGGGIWMVALAYNPEGLIFPHPEFVTYRDLASSDYSTDGGATWQPGSQEVES